MIFRVYPSDSHIFVDAIDEKLPDGTEKYHGYFLLNDIDELRLLRDTVDAYITRNNLTPTSK